MHLPVEKRPQGSDCTTFPPNSQSYSSQHAPSASSCFMSAWILESGPELLLNSGWSGLFTSGVTNELVACENAHFF